MFRRLKKSVTLFVCVLLIKMFIVIYTSNQWETDICPKYIIQS